jgi:hypothetical protein
MAFLRNVAGQAIGAQMVSATDGSAFTGTVTVYITGDGGTQAIGTINSGVCVHEGNGYHSTTLTAAETNYDLIACTFIGTGAVPQTIQIVTQTVATLTPTTGPPATGAITALELITDAYAELNVFLPGESIPATDAQFARRSLNGLLGQLAQQHLTIPSTARIVVDLVSGQGGPDNPYTIGPGGDFDTIRPANAQSLKRVRLLYSDGVTEVDLTCYTDQWWQALTQKTVSGTMPSAYSYDPTFTSGLGAIYLWPQATDITNQLVLYIDAPLSTFADLTTAYQLPPGYQDLLVFGLARRLAKPYGREVDADLLEKAASSLRVIKRSNVKYVEMTSYFGGGGVYDIFTDTVS